MGKTILIIVLGMVVFWMWRKLQAGKHDAATKAPERPAELMVRCAFCGVNQPRGECVESSGAVYCSESHRRQAEARAGGG